MPEAWKIPTGEVNLPRDYFEHAHEDGSAEFPPVIVNSAYATMEWKCPDDWEGFARFRVWFRAVNTVANYPLTIYVNAGTCNEAANTHTENHNVQINVTANLYYCLELTTTFATVLALIAACDVVSVDVISTEETEPIVVIGLEIVESS